MKRNKKTIDPRPVVGYRNEFKGEMGNYTVNYLTKALANKDARRRKDPRVACVELYEGMGIGEEVNHAER